MVEFTVPTCPKTNLTVHEGSEHVSPGLSLALESCPKATLPQAKALVIHYADDSAKEWDHGWPSGLEVVTLDVLNGQNVHDPATWSYV